ncbi:SRPBCC family protein [Rhodovibrionaceae bacterium A322]
MSEVFVTRVVEAPLSDVWASWDDYGSIWKFNPGLKGSYLLEGSTETGIGALRQCDLADGKNYIREKIIGYEPEKTLVLDIYEGTVPIKRATASFEFSALGPNRTAVSMRMVFELKMGILGRLMAPILKGQFTRTLQALLDGNAAYVERGVQVSNA